MRFISPKIDFAFKKIFGDRQSKDILISFLNAMIYQGNAVIDDLEIIDPYNAGEVLALKDTYLDVKAVLKDQTTVIIEMQVLNVAAFEKRVVYNLAKTYGNQLSSGASYFDLNPVIALTITDFVLFPETSKIITQFGFKEEEELFDYRDRELKMFFVELPKFTKKLEQLQSLTEKWIYFLKEADRLEEIATNLEEVAEIGKALRIANLANLNRKELEVLHGQEMFIRDQQGRVIKGREEGREEGRLEGQIGLILRQLRQRLGELPEAIIEQVQKLSLEELDSLGMAIFDLTTLEDLSRWLQEEVAEK